MVKEECITIIDYDVNTSQRHGEESSSSLFERLFCFEDEKKGFRMILTEEDGRYNYEIDYGEINPTLGDVAKYQNLLKKCFENVRKKNPGIQNAVIENRFKTSSLDLFGIKRLSKYLQNDRKIS